MTISPAAGDVLNREFQAIRSRVLDIAAALDRIDRATGDVAGDPRLEKIRRSLQVLVGPSPQRAEQVQMIFSLPYEENWRGQE